MSDESNKGFSKQKAEVESVFHITWQEFISMLTLKGGWLYLVQTQKYAFMYKISGPKDSIPYGKLESDCYTMIIFGKQH
ncbi:hypothetical protein RO3G_02283 [Rhizopus delemar RA 99-880]|uniref:Uncharacterized protein n=1 Tax=Rhizopus delemar (strain RA 99-880 / ATCC MYA-4621 / FGSC 9543 / NRRL 43880) TaxID=246409 RepID=I1BMZ9_RHIO9|nr:hypothetical protein RO3G_02283 [Rhizopus delemar RA 99-880]|eukprot:EIE77579.1 hypothetical protein RO3G_02283 [Rhizopus delemar RA 99-880]